MHVACVGLVVLIAAIFIAAVGIFWINDYLDEARKNEDD